jgi:hypothetical protein
MFWRGFVVLKFTVHAALSWSIGKTNASWSQNPGCPIEIQNFLNFTRGDGK